MTTDTSQPDVASNTPHMVEPGCTKCRPAAGKPKLAPGWFYNSTTRLNTKLPQLGLQEADLQRAGTVTVPEEERLSRVQEWLQRLNKGNEEGLTQDVKKRNTKKAGKTQGNNDDGTRRSTRNMADARNWYINKATRTSVTSIFSGDLEKGTQSKQFPSKLNPRLEPLDQRSANSGSLNGSGSVYTNQLHHHQVPQDAGKTAAARASFLLEEDLVRQHLERKRKMEGRGLDRSFTRTQIMADGQVTRGHMGPIARPHSPVRSLAARQKTLVGSEGWYNRGVGGGGGAGGMRGNTSSSKVHQMQTRTYELQSQLKQMLDRQKSQ